MQIKTVVPGKIANKFDRIVGVICKKRSAQPPEDFDTVFPDQTIRKFINIGESTGQGNILSLRVINGVVNESCHSVRVGHIN